MRVPPVRQDEHPDLFTEAASLRIRSCAMAERTRRRDGLVRRGTGITP